MQPDQVAYPTREQLQQLAEQIRMTGCTQLYITTIMAHMPAIAPCFTASEWLFACGIAGRSVGNAYCGWNTPVRS